VVSLSAFEGSHKHFSGANMCRNASVCAHGRFRAEAAFRDDAKKMTPSLSLPRGARLSDVLSSPVSRALSTSVPGRVTLPSEDPSTVLVTWKLVVHEVACLTVACR